MPAGPVSHSVLFAVSSAFDIVLSAREQVAPGLLLLRFARADGQPLAHQPGQFIQLHLADAHGNIQRRSYSLANRSDQPLPGNQFEFAISLVPGGLAAGLLSTLPIGASVPASGPLGRFCLNPGDSNRRYLLLATGTGVSPYRAMLPALIERMQQGLEVVLLHGARTAAELPYAAEFLALAAAQPRFLYLPCVSRQWPVDLPAACQGHVQEQLARLNPDPEHDIAYLCGNPAMIDAAFAMLRAAGFGMPRLRREKYLSLSGQAAGA